MSSPNSVGQAKKRNHDAPTRAQEPTSHVLNSVILPATISSDASTTDDVPDHPSYRSDEQGYSETRYRVGDRVLARTAGKPAREATIVEIDPLDGSRFNLAFKDKRKKGGWRLKGDLTLFVPVGTAASSASKEILRQKVRVRTSTGSSAGAINETSFGKVLMKSETKQSKKVSTARTDTTAATLAATPIPASMEEATSAKKTSIPLQEGGKASQTGKPTKGKCTKERKKVEEKAAGTAASVENGEEIAGGVCAFGNAAWDQGPPPKRSAATVAERAMPSMHQRYRQSQKAYTADGGASHAGGVSGNSGAKNSQNNESKGKGKGKATPRASSTPLTGKSPRTPREGWTRPKLVTPGSLEGRTEPALRTMHPWEVVRPRKAFKIQQSKSAAKSREDARAAQAPASTFAGRFASSRPALRRPLCQPSHTLQEVKRGIIINRAGAPRRVDENNEEEPRRGRRARRQVHPSLSEDKMAAVSFGDVQSDDDATSEDENESPSHRRPGDEDQKEKPPPRFWKTAQPWGEGDVPRIKVTLSLQEDGAPLSSDRSAIATVSFLADYHRHSGEQLANVLTAKKFLCYHKVDNRVFVLTSCKESEQKTTLKRVRELALSRCGVRVETTPWLVGRPALDEFLDNHRRVLHHIVRHRLAVDTWSEVDGVYFNGLFRGRGSRRTFNGVRLGINLAVSSVADLETGVWDLWITAEPTVHRFSAIDWLELIQEKEDRGLQDFSGSKSDDLERRLQVVCLPNCTRGVVYDVQEEAFEMDRLQEANLKRGYVIGPRLEDEMVEYWRQVHHINLSSSFQFVKVRIGGMVLTYPSWCVIRKHKEVPEATRALGNRILNDFTDALDSMEGMTVQETTFLWHLAGGSNDSSDSGCGGSGVSCFNAPAFKTASGRVIGERNKSTDTVQDDGCGVSVILGSPPQFGPPRDADVSLLSTPGQLNTELGQGGARDDEAPIVAPRGISNNSPSSADTLLPTGSDPNAAGLSPESRAGRAAAQASLAAVRQSFIRRRGAAPPRRNSSGAPAISLSTTGEGEGKELAMHPLCSTPFVIRRPTASSGTEQSSTHDAIERARTANMASKPSGLGKKLARRHLGGIPDGRAPSCASDENVTKAGVTPKATRYRNGAVEGVTDVPDTPHAAGSEALSARLVTPAAGESVPPRRDEDAETNVDGRKRKLDAAIPLMKSFEKSRGESRMEAAAGVVTSGAPRGGIEKKQNNQSTSEGASGPPSSAAQRSGSLDSGSAAATLASSPVTPSKIVVIFVASGSLGMGLHDDETGEGGVVLMGVSPTSAAAHVPNGWRITEVGGAKVQRLRMDRVAPLLRERPVAVTFEPPRKEGPAAATEDESKLGNVRKGQASKSDKIGASRKRGPAKPKKVTPGKKGSKKAAKVTTVRKTFKVQSRPNPPSGDVAGAMLEARATTVVAKAPLGSHSAVI